MKNIPIFTGQHGIASLIFREMGHFGPAYILVKAVWNGETAAFLEECRGFCRAVGAQEIYATYQLEDLPLEHAYDMLLLTRPKDGLPQPGKIIDLEPLTRSNGASYLKIYNDRFKGVPSAAHYDESDLEKLYGEDKAWLVRVDGRYAAIAEISETDLEAIAVLPEYKGLGYDLALTVLPMIPRKEVRLRVADTNRAALALYDRLGFEKAGISARWWKVEK